MMGVIISAFAVSQFRSAEQREEGEDRSRALANERETDTKCTASLNRISFRDGFTLYARRGESVF